MALQRHLLHLALVGTLATFAFAQELDQSALSLDDDCWTNESGEEQCSLSALQRRGLRLQHGSHQDAGSDQAAAQAQNWSWSDVLDYADPATWFTPPGPSSPRPIHPPAPVPIPSPAPVSSADCAGLDAPVNAECKEPIEWIANQGGKYDPQAPTWFEDIHEITGVDLDSATVDDFQRMYFCSPPGGKACGAPPCSCSKPPCNTCYGGAPPPKRRPGCTSSSRSIECKPPAKPLDYKGMSWPTMTYKGRGEMHIFAIGDWGGMDGSLNPVEGRPKIMAYSWGARPGPSVFPRTRWNKYHTVELCGHTDFTNCYDTHGKDCPKSCGFVPEVDEQPQQLVAKAMQERAETNKPQYILNVGDNFYWGGIEKTCGTPMDQISFTAHHQFDQVFEKVYSGGGLADAPWLSVLGNHDWGGRQFNNGWDQQIAYTWASTRWVMPAPYYMVHVDYPDQMFSADIYMTDTNFLDAHSPEKDSEHNICGAAHNPAGADCGAVGGPSSIETCPGYFHDLWQEQKAWLEKKLSQSQATWQILVTHFPCGEDGENQRFYSKLRSRYGLDLLVTGHRHDQELWKATDYHRNRMSGLTCIVTGGGGGISSEATPDPQDTRDWFGEAQYGFFDITVTKFQMKVESINWDGTVARSTTLYPSPR